MQIQQNIQFRTKKTKYITQKLCKEMHKLLDCPQTIDFYNGRGIKSNRKLYPNVSGNIL